MLLYCIINIVKTIIVINKLLLKINSIVKNCYVQNTK